MTSAFRLYEHVSGIVPLGLRLPLLYHILRLSKSLEAEMAWLPRLLPNRSGIAVDVGANYGTYSLILSGPCERVVAFEPVPACARVLRAFASACHRPIAVHEVALGDFDGVATLHVPFVKGRRGLHRAMGLSSLRREAFGEPMPVAVKPLDDFHLNDVAVIKIDAEGFERAVLTGAAEAIARSRPVLLVEIEQRHLAGSTMAEVFDLIES